MAVARTKKRRSSLKTDLCAAFKLLWFIYGVSCLQNLINCLIPWIISSSITQMVHYINDTQRAQAWHVLPHVQILKSGSAEQARRISLASLVPCCVCTTRLQGSSRATWMDVPPGRGCLCSAPEIWTVTNGFSQPWGPQHVSCGQTLTLSWACLVPL